MSQSQDNPENKDTQKRDDQSQPKPAGIGGGDGSAKQGPLRDDVAQHSDR